jgi:Tfp pilus assembly PilM family ATPase
MYLKILTVIVLISICLGYFYYSQSQISSLIEDRAILTQKQEQYKLGIKELESAIRKQAELTRTLNEEALKAKALANEALAVIDKHNLEFLSFAKPELIEKRVNNATSRVFKDIEDEINN